MLVYQRVFCGKKTDQKTCRLGDFTGDLTGVFFFWRLGLHGLLTGAKRRE